MTARDSRRVVRATQIGFIVLLLACSAQLAYWMADEYRYTQTVRDHRFAAYEEQAQSAAALLAAGVPWAQIAPAQPQVELGADGVPRVSARMLAQLDADRFHRLNRYTWEGAFFLAVLIAAMGVVYAALREEHSLHRQQEDFLAAASHELKSPLASLRLSAETIAMRDPAPPRRAELVQRLLSDIGRLDQMIANVLDASRLSRDGVRASRERVDLGSVLESVGEELRPLAEDCGVRITVDAAKGLAVDADREGVRTIARNLIHNGIKASRANGGTVTVHAARDDHGVTIFVEDHGIGFAPDESRRLFQKFHRIEANGHERLPGTGLGLYLVRRCAEIDGADVSAISDGPGHGAAVRGALAARRARPRERHERAHPAGRRRAQPRPRHPGESRGRGVRGGGARRTACTPSRKIRAEEFGLVILDVMLPGIDGFTGVRARCAPRAATRPCSSCPREAADRTASAASRRAATTTSPSRSSCASCCCA